MRCTFCGWQPRKKLPLARLNENRSPKGYTGLTMNWQNVTVKPAAIFFFCYFFFVSDYLYRRVSVNANVIMPHQSDSIRIKH